MTPPGTEHGQVVLFGDALSEAVANAAEGAARLRAIDDRTPAEVEASRSADMALHESVAAAERVLDLWVAQPLGLAGARDEALQAGDKIIAGEASLLGDEAADLARRHSALHWPLAFAEAFARERPGFDVVVGNPPWEEIKVEELGFFGLYRPGLRSMPGRAKGEIEKLKTLYRSWSSALTPSSAHRDGAQLPRTRRRI